MEHDPGQETEADTPRWSAAERDGLTGLPVRSPAGGARAARGAPRRGPPGSRGCAPAGTRPRGEGGRGSRPPSVRSPRSGAGVQPHEAAARLAQPFHLGSEALARIAVEPVGDEQHHRALAAHPARPLPVEPSEALTDPGPPAPVFHLFARALHRRVHVAVSELAGDIGEPRAEHEGGHPAAVAGEGVREVEQHSRVSAHRPRDVAEHHDGGGLPEPPPPHEQDLPGAVPEAPSEGGPHVDERAPGMRAVTAGRGRRHREPSLAMAAFASASSAADICSKSRVRSTSRSDRLGWHRARSLLSGSFVRRLALRPAKSASLSLG